MIEKQIGDEPSAGAQATDKFMGYIDILGWSDVVKNAEAGRGVSFSDLPSILDLLGTYRDRSQLLNDGPSFPRLQHLRRDLDFQISRFSDCTLVSVEVSSAGLMHLIEHCYAAQFKLLRRGFLCRGVLGRGSLFHTADHQIGSGLIGLVAREKSVSFNNDGKWRTPYILVESEVVDFVRDQMDSELAKLFSKLTMKANGAVAIFPYRMDPSQFINGVDSDRDLASVREVQRGIQKLQEQVKHYYNPSDSNARYMRDHCLQMLDQQLKDCADVEQMILDDEQPYPAHSLGPMNPVKITRSSERPPGIF